MKEKRPSREVGTIVRFNADEKYGFIRGGPHQADHYFKFGQLNFDVERMQIGDKVSFEARVKYGKLRAEVIKRSR